jgi:hypothetical protein
VGESRGDCEAKRVVSSIFVSLSVGPVVSATLPE